jgi:L-alanine-DL-glutamate epimerase-like enolase superfamily enzyme
MALIDAAANSVRIPLWRLFGGKSNSITTDITVKFCFYFSKKKIPKFIY